MNISSSHRNIATPSAKPTQTPKQSKPANEAPKDSFQWTSNLKQSAGPTLMSVTSAATTQLGGMGALASPLLSTGNYALGGIRLLDAYRTANNKPIDGNKGIVAIASGALGLAAGIGGIIASAKVGNALPLLLCQLPAVAANVAAGLIDPQS